MKIITLIENTAGNTGLLCEHGLSVYIETGKHKVLVDAGASAQVLENAKALGVDLTQVDTLVLSHGHYDHSGGILPFAELNPSAEIYMQNSAVLEYVSTSHGNEHYIGIDQKILELPKLKLFTMEEGEIFKIDEELQIFSGITGKRLSPNGNKTLFQRINGEMIRDSFVHEECLAVFAEGKKLLFSGCAHNGIVNILDRYQELYGCDPDYVFSGFHMMKDDEYNEDDISIIRGTAEELKKKHTVYYSGHCTSQAGFDLLKEILGDQLHYMHSGTLVNL